MNCLICGHTASYWSRQILWLLVSPPMSYSFVDYMIFCEVHIFWKASILLKNILHLMTGIGFIQQLRVGFRGTQRHEGPWDCLQWKEKLVSHLNFNLWEVPYHCFLEDSLWHSVISPGSEKTLGRRMNDVTNQISEVRLLGSMLIG